MSTPELACDHLESLAVSIKIENRDYLDFGKATLIL